MSSVGTGDAERARRRRRLSAQVKDSMRALRSQLTLLNHQVGAHLDLKDVDLDCLDLIGMHGPLTPSTLARLAGLHPATVTGILDRLQRGGWVVRERDPEAADRRAVTVRSVPDRARDLFRLYAGMSQALDELLADYDDAQLELLTDFLRRATAAGRTATDTLAADPD